MSELVLNLGTGEQSFVKKTADPVMSPAAATPGDFTAQFPQPLDTTEIVAMCEEIGLWRALPEKATALKSETWRELNTLAFTSGSAYISFADGTCPEEFYHSGNNTTIDLKNIGAHKSLEISDIMHSAAVAAAGWNGINRLIGGFQFGEGVPGGNDQGTFMAESVADLKAKEMALEATLVLNGWDKLLVNGNAVSNALQFSGLETLINDSTAHSNTPSGTQNASGTYTGSFNALNFDRFLAEGCAKPTVLAGHPQVIQELMSGYFQLGFQGSQIIMNNSGDRLVPGFNFAGEVNTGIGPLKVIADRNFAVTTNGSGVISSVFALRMVHNGEPLIYKLTQIPFSFRDLTPGCTAIQFEVWAKTALIVKALCAQGRYYGYFVGRTVTTCPQI